MKKLSKRAIRGAGGGGKGGGSQHVASEAPNSLRSVQYARIIDVVSEGEIEGLVNGLKSIYLDDTPIQNADGSNNFTGVTMVARNGTQDQAYVPGFPAVESETAVSTEVTAAASVTRSISNANVNAVRVTISVPQLTFQNTQNGDISGTSVEIAVDVQANGGGFVQQMADTISGKTTSRYQRSYRIELTGSPPWDVRVRRVTADSVQSNLADKTFWDSYTEIIDAKLAYPNSALVALMVSSEQFKGIPKRGYEIKGIRVQVPSNYNPSTRVYTGVWDGTFSVAWTDNPAWCFYDLLENDRYGLGEFIQAAQIDKWTLYQIGQYCDELVSNGFGGTEPRFTCNLYLQTREEAYRVIVNFSSIFRSIVYWMAGAITAVQDAPSDPVALFTAANVIDGKFTYSGSSRRTRHTVALVSWNDPADRYRQKIEYVEDHDGIDTYGVLQTEMVAMGCTSRGQAHRIGKWLLYSERMETETVSFRTGLDGVLAAPGQVIKTADPARAGVRMGGRIMSATTTVISLDSSVTIDAGQSYTLWCVMPDGTVESRSVSSAPGQASTLVVATAYSDTPQALSVWLLASTNVEAESWRVISVVEAEKSQIEFSALAYRPEKYDAVEQDLILEPLSVSTVTVLPASPTNISITESLYLITPVIVGTRVTVSWSGQAFYYIVEYSRDDDNPVSVTTSETSIDIQPAQPGIYIISVIAVNALGLRSAPAPFSKTVFGLTAPPEDVTGFQLAALSGYAYLTWDPTPDLDVLVGGYMHIRFTPDIDTPDWSSAVDIGPTIPGTATSTTLPLLAGAYLAKWVDGSEIESESAVSITTDAANIIAMNFVAEAEEDPDFTGVKVNVGVLDGALKLESIETIGQQEDPMSTWPLISAIGGGFAPEGTYYFANVIDLGSVQTVRLSADLAVQGFDGLDLISYRPLVSTWASVVGALVNDVGCVIYVRTTSDDPQASPATWSDWQPFFVGEWTTRGLEFKAVLTSEFVTHNIRVTTLNVIVDMPDRVQADDDVVSDAGETSVVFVLPFMASPALGITAQDMQTGDYYTVSGKDQDGFNITFRNAAGTAVSRTFDWIAKGY